MRPRLSKLAQADLDAIRSFGNITFGSRATDQYLEKLLDLFDLLCFSPRIAKEVPEAQNGMRMHPYKAHSVYFTLEDDSVLIVRVLHGRQNWRDHIYEAQRPNL